MRTSHQLAAAVTVLGGLLLAVASTAPVPALSQAVRIVRAGATRAAPRELIYVANADSGPVTAYPAGSEGTVAPARTVLAPNDPNAFWDPWGVTFDASGHLYVQTFLSDATTTVFAPGAHGTIAPERDFMGISPDNRSIAVDANGYEYVAGNVKPLRTIEGPATGLAGTSITGITSSRCDGTIYAMVHTSSTGFGPGHIDAYGLAARGNARPLRVFTDRRSGFKNAQGLTITNCGAS